MGKSVGEWLQEMRGRERKPYIRLIEKDWKNFKNLLQWKEYLQLKLSTDDAIAQRGLVIIYFNQTNEEIERKRAIKDNSVGFGKVDAAYLTKLAHKIMGDLPLTEYEALQIRLRMPHYWRQIHDYIKKSEEKNAVPVAPDFVSVDELPPTEVYEGFEDV